MLKSSTDDYLSWDEVLEQQGFIDLPGEQKELARMAYFDEVVAPRVSRKYQRVARAEFDDYSLPTLLTNEQKDQIQRKQEIQDYEDAGGGVLSSLDRGGRRLKQGLAGAGAA